MEVGYDETNTVVVKRGANARVQACAGGFAHKNGDVARIAHTERTSYLSNYSSDFENSKWGTCGNAV